MPDDLRQRVFDCSERLYAVLVDYVADPGLVNHSRLLSAALDYRAVKECFDGAGGVTVVRRSVAGVEAFVR